MQVGTEKPKRVFAIHVRWKWPFLHGLSAVLLLPINASHAERHEFSTVVMGTRAELICYSRDHDAVEQAWSHVQKRWRELDQILSDYRSDSEIMILAARQRESPKPWTPVSAELFELLRQCQDLSRRSHGAFDVTVGPLTRVWRQARRNGTVPSDEKLARAQALVGYQNLELDPATSSVRFLKPGMRLDFGAIGKGYAADVAIEALRQHGIHQALANLGGDVAVSDAPPQMDGWRVSIAGQTESQIHVVSNCGVASSGDTARGISRDGIRLSHILDPRTSKPLVDSCSVTVIADNGTHADALATILSVMGPRDGPQWLAREFPGATVQYHQ